MRRHQMSAEDPCHREQSLIYEPSARVLLQTSLQATNPCPITIISKHTERVTEEASLKSGIFIVTSDMPGLPSLFNGPTAEHPAIRPFADRS